MATISASVASADSPRIMTDGGLVVRSQTYAWSLSSSAGDTVRFTNIKIPHGATIVKVELMGRVQNNNGAHIYQVGLNGSAASGLSATMFGSATMSLSYARVDVINGNILPYKVSVSDDAANRFVTPMITVDAVTSGTVSQTTTLMIHYIMNQT